MTRLLSHEPFVERVAGDIVRIAGELTPAPPERNGEARGGIENFQLLGTPLFAAEGWECGDGGGILPFSGQARISGRWEPVGGGAPLPFTHERDYSGHVELGWPRKASAEDFEALYPRISIRTVVDFITPENAPPHPGTGNGGRPPAPLAEEESGRADLLPKSPWGLQDFRARQDIPTATPHSSSALSVSIAGAEG